MFFQEIRAMTQSDVGVTPTSSVYCKYGQAVRELLHEYSRAAFFTSLLLRLDEHSLHTLAVVTSSIERILADIVAITLKAVNSIKINNL